MINNKHRVFSAPVARWLSVGCVASGLALVASGCGSDEKGTDINVAAPTAGSSGNGAQGGSSNGTAGTGSGDTTNDESGAADGGAASGGTDGAISGGGTGGGGMSGTSGAAGNLSGGSAGTSGTARVSGGGSGNGGSAGAAGQSGASGSAGTTCQAGTAGTAGASGTAGTAGTSGAGGAAGTSGTGGTAGSAGSGGTAGTAGTGGTAGSSGTAGTGGTGGSQTCGNGSIEGNEECDDSGPSRLCSDDCRTVSTPECVECEQHGACTPADCGADHPDCCEQQGDCFASSDNCLGPTATPFTAENIALCFDVMRCIQETNCLDGAGTLGKCYCGTLSTAACQAAPFNLTAPGAPNGPCAVIMQKGNPGVTSNSTMLGGLTTKSRPAGAAGQRLNCEKNDPTCAPICGVQ